jgi:PKD repeat protein
MKQFQYNRYILFSLLICIALLTTPCKKAIYVPAEGDVIQLQAETTIIAPGESVIITITGIKASGQAMPDNTLVVLSADSGKFLDPVGDLTTAVRLISGKAEATYQADEDFTGESVTITAQSGTAVVSPEQLVITIQSVAIAQLFMTADPLTLPPSGGTTEITVIAYDSQLDVAAGEKILLETTAGTLTPPSPIVSDSDGKVVVTLETTEAASVTASHQEITNTIEISLEVNEPPTAAFEFSPQNPVMGDTVYFISTSSDSDGTIVSHAWNFGDGTTSNEENPTHQFPVTDEEKEYQVVLTVTDDGGTEVSVAQTVPFALVEQVDPVADFTFAPENPDIGETVQFTSLSTDEDGTIEAYQWYFGDGTSSTEENPQHRYNIDEAAVLTVQLTVTDNDGNTADITKEITVGNIDNQPPVPDFAFSPQDPKNGDTVYFNAAASTDSDGTIVSYSWDFGDGTVGSGETVEHIYYVDTETTFTVVLTVTDNDGSTAAVSKEITVTVI